MDLTLLSLSIKVFEFEFSSLTLSLSLSLYVCARLCVFALRVAFMDKILRLTNILIIIIY